MPRELDELYQETLERIQRQPGEDGELGMRVLSWVTHTRTPLSVEELRYGLAVEYDEAEEQPNEIDEENLLSASSLLDVCGGLVVIDPISQTIRLVHYTTQEFFDKERLHLFKSADEDISKACLTYLSYDICGATTSQDLMSETLLAHPFLGYASLHWLSHVKGRYPEVEDSPVFPKAVAYVHKWEHLLFSAMVWRKLLLPPRTYRPSDIRVSEGMLPLPAASACGLFDYVIFLLDHAPGPKAVLDEALHCASSQGHADIVRLLINRGADVESLAADSSNALQRACKGGHLETAQIVMGIFGTYFISSKSAVRYSGCFEHLNLVFAKAMATSQLKWVSKSL
jgi:hypothetical protein